MKFQFSAGGIVYKTEDKKLFILLCQHSQHHGWGFPKGLIGDKKEGESKESTALREVEEETGVKGEILGQVDPVSFWFVFEGEKVKKTVYYYLMKFLEGDIAEHDDEMENVEWIEAKNVIEKLTFKADKEAFNSALPKIVELNNIKQ